jgi:hypothetical protein
MQLTTLVLLHVLAERSFAFRVCTSHGSCLTNPDAQSLADGLLQKSALLLDIDGAAINGLDEVEVGELLVQHTVATPEPRVCDSSRVVGMNIQLTSSEAHHYHLRVLTTCGHPGASGVVASLQAADFLFGEHEQSRREEFQTFTCHIGEAVLVEVMEEMTASERRKEVPPAAWIAEQRWRESIHTHKEGSNVPDLALRRIADENHPEYIRNMKRVAPRKIGELRLRCEAGAQQVGVLQEVQLCSPGLFPHLGSIWEDISDPARKKISWAPRGLPPPPWPERMEGHMQRLQGRPEPPHLFPLSQPALCWEAVMDRAEWGLHADEPHGG